MKPELKAFVDDVRALENRIYQLIRSEVNAFENEHKILVNGVFVNFECASSDFGDQGFVGETDDNGHKLESYREPEKQRMTGVIVTLDF